MREQTLKSVLTFITKLSDRTINGELLKYLAKTANDEQPGIRTNTTICLGKIAKHLGTSTRAKVLIAAFTRSLRDPFVHARNASLMALAVTAEYFTEEDCAVRILPSICPSLIDKEKLIRDQASKTMDIYVVKVKKAAASMPDTVLPPETATAGAPGPRMSTPQPTESSAAAWAGWAISSFTNKLSAAAGEIESSSIAAASSAPQPKRPAPVSQNSSASTLHRQALKSPSASSAPPSSAKASSLFSDPEPAAEDGFEDDDAADAWGDMDDMADDDNDTKQEGDDFFSSTASTITTTATQPKKKPSTSSAPATATAMPFDDGSEPDFAGWLAAQAQKKNAGKALPKGLAKPASGTGAGARKTSTTSTASKTTKVVAAPVKKKIDMKPKQADDDDDGWGGW